MPSNRHISLLLLLQTGHRTSAPELADDLGVSVRTIYRDVERLSEAGVPIYAEAGKGGGIRLVEGYRTRLTGLDLPESEALALAGWSTVAEALGVGSAAAAAERKLLAALPNSAAASARRTHERFHVDLARWYAAPEMSAHLPAVARAVWDRRRLRIDYASWTTRRKRDVDPLGIVLKNATWYLVAAHGGEVRTYRVSEIDSLATLDATFEPAPDFDLRSYWEASTRRFERDLKREVATLRYSPAARPLIERLSAQPIAQTGEDSNVVTVRIESIESAARDILAFGDAVEVLAPPALRRRVADAARATADL